MTDQGLFASSNFALNILLARWLTPYEYGIFGLAFAVFILVNMLHQATLTEPLLVFGPGKHKGHLSEYVGALVYGHVGFAVVSSFALLAAGWGFALWGSSELSEALVALAITGPFILLLWLMRQACYARFEPRLSASGGVWYMVLMLAGTYVLYRFGWLSTTTALGVTGASSLVAGIWLMARLRVKRPPLREGNLVRESLKDHWKYGRWSVPSKALAWVPHNAFYVLLPIWGGFEAGASFRALMNLLMPVLHGTTAVSVLLLPTFVQAREQPATFGSRVRLALIPFVLVCAVYWVLLGVFGGYVIGLVYGGQYTEYADLLWLLGLVPIVATISGIVSHALRALERPDRLFLALVFSTLITATVGVSCVYLWGVAGAGVGLILAHGSAAALAVVLLVTLCKRSVVSVDTVLENRKDR